MTNVLEAYAEFMKELESKSDEDFITIIEEAAAEACKGLDFNDAAGGMFLAQAAQRMRRMLSTSKDGAK